MKLARCATIALMLAALFALPAFAVQDADIDWGKDNGSGDWGFRYVRGVDEEEGKLVTFFNIRHSRDRYNKTINGPYADGAPSVTTIVGARLGVDYSPFTARMNSSSRILGYRVAGYPLAFGNSRLTLDGTYGFGYYTGENVFDETPEIVGPLTGYWAFGAKGNVGPASVTAAALSRPDDPSDPEKLYWNYSIISEVPVTPRITLKGTYAAWQGSPSPDRETDWLYEASATWDLRPGVLSLRAATRNSEIDTDDEFSRSRADHVRVWMHANNSEDYVWIRNSGRDEIRRIWRHDESYSVGLTRWFMTGLAAHEFKVDYTTTNPKHRNDLDDHLEFGLNTKYRGFSLEQTFSVMMPDEATTDRGDPGIYDEEMNRYDYSLLFNSPRYRLPFDFGAVVRVSWDLDYNHDQVMRDHSIIGLHVNAVKQIWKARNVNLDGVFIYDMPHAASEAKDLFKYALRATYNAPNGVRFRLEYLSSPDYASDSREVHGEPLYVRYAPFRFYDPEENENDRFHGVRLLVSVPF